MALITCPECGKEISSKATSCPNCGAPIADLMKIPVYFSRERRFRGSDFSGTVMVDGVTVGSAGNGAEFKCMLTAGSHNIVINQAASNDIDRFLNVNAKTQSKTITIPDDAKSVYISMGVVWPGLSSGQIVVTDVEVRR